MRPGRARVWLTTIVILAAACSSPSPSPATTAPPTTPSSSPPTTAAPAPPTWRALPKAPIVGRISAGVVWTGDEVIVWGGGSRGGNIEAVGDGPAYDPTHDSWRAIAPAPSGVLGGGGEATAWTGEAAVFWAANSPDRPVSGGVYDPAGDSRERLLQIYDPGSDSWEVIVAGISLFNSREGSAIAWTGADLVVGAGSSHVPGTPPRTAAARSR